VNPTVDGGEFGKKAITVHLRDDVVIVAIGEQGIRKNRLFVDICCRAEFVCS